MIFPPFGDSITRGKENIRLKTGRPFGIRKGDVKMKLPEAFLRRMAQFPSINMEELLSCYETRLPRRGIRRNPLKCGEEAFFAGVDLPLEPAPFSEYSYYLPETAEGIGRTALHHAGAFYVQEPSAASAVTILDPQPGERVLDLCAAPGGKSTQIAGALNGEGLLWANEVVLNRAEVLRSNLERLGARNAVVSNCHPDVLCSALAGFLTGFWWMRRAPGKGCLPGIRRQLPIGARSMSVPVRSVN